jgi:periplasmic protein TonB
VGAIHPIGRFLALNRSPNQVMHAHALPEVYSPRDIAAAAGVPEPHVIALLARGEIRSVATLAGAAGVGFETFVPHPEAVRAVRALRSGDLVVAPGSDALGRLLSPTFSQPRATTVPMLVSSSLHAVVLIALLVIGSLGFTAADERTEVIEPASEPVRLVYVPRFGPGGGGGGGGLKMPTPPPKAQLQGPRKVSSPIPARRIPPPVRPEPPRPEPPPPPLEAKTLPPVMAPVVPVAADQRNQEGQLKEVPKESPPSQGPGSGGGAGTGKGTGIGEGDGAGIGPGEGGGVGGGPYRPGSGVSPPQLVREVRADYTDEARRANIVGEVVLEIVVKRDGTVGDVRVLQRLGAGLVERAIAAVRQWKFSPARLKGTPVDVVVEVAVEFKLR